MSEPVFRRLDPAADPRRAHFEYFRAMAYPYVGVTCEVDVTDFAAAVRAAGQPFFLSFLWHAARAANAVPELRRRLDGDGAVEYDRCPTSHTVARPDGTYCYCRLDGDRPLREFLPYAREAQARALAAGGIDDGDDPRPLLFVSTVPWLSYTALVQPVPSPADSNPRLTWGRMHAQEGRTLMPVSLLCHHALVDGLHLARFYEALGASLAAR